MNARVKELLTVAGLLVAAAAVSAAVATRIARPPVVTTAPLERPRDHPTGASMEVRFSAACVSGPGCPNCMDCICGTDEVAVTGGGWCGPNNAMIESAHLFGTSNEDRFINVWRVGCSVSPPPNAYVLCTKGMRSEAQSAAPSVDE